MNERSRAEFKFWPLTFLLVALVSTYAFFQDIIRPDWPAWFIAPTLVIAFRGAVSIAPENSFMKAALYQGALIVVPFMGIFGLIDAVTKTNWPEWVISPAIVVVFWAVLSLLVDAETD